MSAVRRIYGRKRAAPSRLTPDRCPDCGHSSVMVGIAECPKCGHSMPVELVRGPGRKKPSHYEDKHQTELFKWAKLAKCTMPDLAKLYHVPNGGGRSKAEAGRLKAQGVVAGVLDLSLDVARGGYFGLRIELKATRDELGRKPEVSPDQRKRIVDLRADNYCAVVCEGWEQAKDTLTAYLSEPKTEVA